MAIVTAAVLNAIIDNCCGYYLDVLGTSGSGFGYGTGPGSWGASTKATNLQTVLSGSSDLSFIAQMSTSVLQLGNLSTGVIQAGADISPVLFALQQNVTNFSPNASVNNIDAYMTYLNTANPASYWAALQNPAWQTLGSAWFTGRAPSAWNTYADAPSANSVAPVYTNGLATKVVGGSFTAGVTIDSTKFAGGVPAIIVSGITGSGVVTVTGTARNPASFQTPVTGVTWTVTATGNGTFALAVGTAPANSLILAVSAISAAGGISAGTIEVVSQAPAGRPSEP